MRRLSLFIVWSILILSALAWIISYVTEGEIAIRAGGKRVSLALSPCIAAIIIADQPGGFDVDTHWRKSRTPPQYGFGAKAGPAWRGAYMPLWFPLATAVMILLPSMSKVSYREKQDGEA